MSRNSVANRIGVPEASLRLWESDGLLPAFRDDAEADYEVMVRIVKAARDSGVSGQALRRLLVAEEERHEVVIPV